MTRRISCAMTVEAVERMTKTVTRRHPDTWRNLKPGDELIIVAKAQGLAKGEKQRKLARVRVTDVWLESICTLTDQPEYGLGEMFDEGCAHMAPAEFVDWWISSHGFAKTPRRSVMCRRIQWRYLERMCRLCGGTGEMEILGVTGLTDRHLFTCWHCDGSGLIEVDR